MEDSDDLAALLEELHDCRAELEAVLLREASLKSQLARERRARSVTKAKLAIAEDKRAEFYLAKKALEAQLASLRGENEATAPGGQEARGCVESD